MNTVIYMGDKITAIQKKYGPAYYKNENTLTELIKLWGGHPNQNGVFPYEKETLYTAKKIQIDINTACTAKGLWLYSLSVSYQSGGFSSAPSVYNHFAYASKVEARHHAIEALLAWSRTKDPCPVLTKFTSFLKEEQTPQLSLF